LILVLILFESLAIELRAMEETDKGFNVGEDVTLYDRLIAMLGTLNRKYIDRILNCQ